MPTGLESNGDSWYLPNENAKDSIGSPQAMPMVPMHTLHSAQAQSTVSHETVEPKHHSNPTGLTVSPYPTAPYAHTHNSPATEVAQEPIPTPTPTLTPAPSSSVSTASPQFDLAPSPRRASVASPCPASPVPKGTIPRKNSSTTWKRRNWHPLATPELRPKMSPVIPTLNQQNGKTHFTTDSHINRLFLGLSFTNNITSTTTRPDSSPPRHKIKLPAHPGWHIATWREIPQQSNKR
jgi:hypothetical protein